MEDCKDCNKSFAEEHQGLLEDVCFLKEIAFADIFVKTSENDPFSGYLSDKLQGTSGISVVEYTNGVSGNYLEIGFDLNFLDNRYLGQFNTVITFPLNGGTRNGLTYLEWLEDGVEALNFPNKKTPFSSWNVKIPKQFTNGNTYLSIDWTVTENVSGYVYFQAEYDTKKNNEIIGLSYLSNLSGFTDGTVLKMINSEINLPDIFELEDQFLLKLSRQSQSINDTLNTSVKIIGVSLKYR